MLVGELEQIITFPMKSIKKKLIFGWFLLLLLNNIQLSLTGLCKRLIVNSPLDLDNGEFTYYIITMMPGSDTLFMICILCTGIIFDRAFDPGI